MGRGIVIIDDPWDDKPKTQEQKEKLLKWFKFIKRSRPKLYFEGIHIADVERGELFIGIDPAAGEDKAVVVVGKIKDGRIQILQAQVLQEADGESEKE